MTKRIFGIVFLMIILIIVSLPAYYNYETKSLNPETRKEAPGTFVELSQGFTHYEEAGQDTAPTILLIHGFSVPYYIWDPTFESLLDSGFHVIRYDLFGRGYSDRPDARYDREFYDQQIIDLLNALNITKPISIVGLSMGGAINAEFTVNHPDKVNKLVLIDPVHEATDISVLGTPLLGEYLMNVFLTPTLAESQLSDFYEPGNFSDWPVKYQTQLKYHGFKKAILSTLRNYMIEDKLPVYQKLGQLHKPVLLIWGVEDQTLPYAGNVRIREVVECTFLSVEKARHLPHYERPELVNSEIIRFLKD